MNKEYTLEEHNLIRKLFNQNFDDHHIARRVRELSGRRCGWEAIRKQRRILQLKKAPSHTKRWAWVPQQDQYADFDRYFAAAWITPAKRRLLTHTITVDLKDFKC